MCGKVPEREEEEYRLLRMDVCTGKWSLFMAGGKNRKPKQYFNPDRGPRAHEHPQYVDKCPFCAGNENRCLPDILRMMPDGTVIHKPDASARQGEWSVRVVRNIFPMLITPPGYYMDEDHLSKIPHSGAAAGKHNNEVINPDPFNSCYPQLNGIGYSEVVIESPLHNSCLGTANSNETLYVLKALIGRGKALAAEPQVRQVLFIKQYGLLSGGSLVHPHSQVITLPIVSPDLEKRINCAAEFYATEGQCAACRTLVQDPLGSGPSRARLVYETERFVASVPYAARPHRVTITPKQHCADLLQLDTEGEAIAELACVLQLVMEAIYYGLDDPDYNIIYHTCPVRDKLSPEERASIDKSFHWFIVVQPRFPADIGGFELVSGIRMVDCLPDDNAREMREYIAQRLGTDKHQNHWFDRKYGKLQDMTLPDMQIVRNKTV
jgi:UDPglucose--hexose-1-phosphate uridylyltransferase